MFAHFCSFSCLDFHCWCCCVEGSVQKCYIVWHQDIVTAIDMRRIDQRDNSPVFRCLDVSCSGKSPRILQGSASGWGFYRGRFLGVSRVFHKHPTTSSSMTQSGFSFCGWMVRSERRQPYNEGVIFALMKALLLKDIMRLCHAHGCRMISDKGSAAQTSIVSHCKDKENPTRAKEHKPQRYIKMAFIEHTKVY